MKPRTWIFEILIAIDRLINAILRGSADETLSARAHRMRLRQQPYWWWTADLIDTLFLFLGQMNHCERAHMHEVERRNARVQTDLAGLQLPPEMTPEG
jgi:hypothetical protein